MSSLAEVWTAMPYDEILTTRLRLHLVQVDCYLSSPPYTSYWSRRQVKKHGWTSIHPICWDLVVADLNGKQSRVLLRPGLGSVLDGQLQPGITFIVNQVMRSPELPEDETAKKYYMTIVSWSRDEDPQSFSLSYTGVFQPSDYLVRTVGGLCSPSARLLCPWTYFTTHTHLSSIRKPQRFFTLTSLSKATDLLNRFLPEVHNLGKLNESWTHVSMIRSPLVVRVLAKSKNKMLLRPENDRKPFILMTNLLVADWSGYCKVSLWDEAVDAMTSNIVEGDILVLGYEKYKVNKFRPKQHAMNHPMVPKVAMPSLTALSIELKLNYSDLNGVAILDAGAILPNNFRLPPSIWNFLSLKDMRSNPNKTGGGRLVDLTGVVTYHGRWERERCLGLHDGKPTGQFWIRTWLRVADHTSLAVDEESDIAVKIYIDQERWDAVAGAVPGLPCVFTHLLMIQYDGNLSYLECTNETMIFSGESALSSRFVDSHVVEQFRHSWFNNSDQWSDFIRVEGSFGGHIHPPAKANLSLRSVGFVLRSCQEITFALRHLPWKTSARVLVKSRLIVVDEFDMSATGSCSHIRQPLHINLETEADREALERVVGDREPTLRSFVKRIQGLDDEALRQSFAATCLLPYDDRSAGVQSDRAAIILHPIRMCLLKMSDCVVWCEASHFPLEQLMAVGDSTKDNVICLDLFRFDPLTDKNKPHEGVEFVLRTLMTSTVSSAANDSDGTSVDLADDTQSSINNTIDVFKPFLGAAHCDKE